MSGSGPKTDMIAIFILGGDRQKLAEICQIHLEQHYDIQWLDGSTSCSHLSQDFTPLKHEQGLPQHLRRTAGRHRSPPAARTNPLSLGLAAGSGASLPNRGNALP